MSDIADLIRRFLAAFESRDTGRLADSPIRNMAVYEIRDGLIDAWREYTDSAYSGELLDKSKPIPAYQWT